MARTASNMLPLGTRMPSFSLPDAVSGEQVSSDDFADREAMLVMFLCNHCPFVKHIRDGLAAFARDYQDRDLAIVAINSNDVEAYPADAPPRMKEEARAAGYVFPYLFDESQKVAHAFRAACTPDFFLFDGHRLLFYRGQFDGSRPGNGVPVTGRDLRAATDAALAGRTLTTEQLPSVGCNIKWRPENGPEARQ